MEWKKVESDIEPKALDISSSPHMVYLRRNIIKKQKAIDMGDSSIPIEYWECEECSMTREEYEQQQASLELPSTQTIMQSISDLELSIAMIGVE